MGLLTRFRIWLAGLIMPKGQPYSAAHSRRMVDLMERRLREMESKGYRGDGFLRYVNPSMGTWEDEEH